MVRRRAPREFFAWQALESGSFEPNYFMHIAPERKLIYTEVPKTASSYILAQLTRAFGRGRVEGNLHRRGKSGLTCPRALGIGAFVELIDDPQTLIFSSVRNPFTRLVSCYLDKFANVVIGDGSYVSNSYIAYRRLAGKFVIDGRPLSVEEFAVFACETAALRYDGHWCRQSDIISNWVAKPSVLVRFESLNTDLAVVLARLGADAAQVQQVRDGAVVTTDARARDLLSERSMARIAEAYAADFERFGYATKL